MSALESMEDKLNECIASLPPTLKMFEGIKEIQVGHELMEEMRRLVNVPASPFHDFSRYRGIPIIERTDCFPVGAHVMGAITYTDPDKFPTLIERTILTAQSSKEKN
jgi:hypothetical protein